MHPLQSHVLKELTVREKARYRELKPSSIESNRFVYHLNRLIDDGLVGKSAQHYFLTAPGKRYISRLSLKSFLPRSQPKIVSVIIVQDKKGKYLLMHSRRQPFLGKISFPYGKIHYGETLEEAALRELKEKTGLSATLKHCGEAYLVIRERGEIISHMLCHVFHGQKPVGNLLRDAKTHTTSWSSLEEFPKKMLIPGFLELNKLRTKNTRFFAEITV